MTAKRNPGLGLIVTGAILLMFGGPVIAIPLWYLNYAGIGMVAGVGVPIAGLVLIVVGAIRNSRRVRMPVAPPPISN